MATAVPSPASVEPVVVEPRSAAELQSTEVMELKAALVALVVLVAASVVVVLVLVAASVALALVALALVALVALVAEAAPLVPR